MSVLSLVRFLVSCVGDLLMDEENVMRMRRRELLFGPAFFVVGMLCLWHCGPQVECTLSSDCDPGKSCRAGKCSATVTGCQSDADCQTLERCFLGSCTPKTPPLPDAGPEPVPEADGGQDTTPVKETLVTDQKPVPEGPQPDGAPPPDKACVSDRECRPNGVCRASYDGSQIVRRCAPLDGGKKEGEACTLVTECASGQCHQNKCVDVCIAHRHCKTGYYCGDVRFLENTTSRGCIKGVRSDCSGDEDCDEAKSCQADFNTATNKVVTACTEPKQEDKEKLGAKCTPGVFPGVCASHVCDPILKECLEICQPGLDCKTAKYECQPYPFLKGTLFACFPAPKFCGSQSECSTGTFCSAIPKDGGVEVRCLRERASQPKKIGEACNPRAQGVGECLSGLCLPDTVGAVTGKCVLNCKQDSDCTQTPDTPLCGKIRLSNGALARACIRTNAPCDTDQTCPSTEPHCAVGLFQGKPILRCEKAGSRTQNVGDSCDDRAGTNNECRNRICVRGLASCAATCASDADCTQGKVCREIFIGDFRGIKACVQPSSALCNKEKDCVHPSVCRAEKETDTQSGEEVIRGRCGIGGGSDTNSVCAPTTNDTFSPQCKTQICDKESEVCSNFCATDTDCLLGKCVKRQLEGKEIQVCQVGCYNASDCGANQRCSAIFINNRLFSRCVPDDASKKARDASCDPTKILDAECSSGFCGYATKTCTDFCKTSSDCKSNEVCATSFIQVSTSRYVNAQGCFPKTGSCEGRNDCINNTQCLIRVIDGVTTKTCTGISPNRKIDGAACDPTKPDECQSGYCDPTNKVCLTTCKEDADCLTPGYKSCSAVSIQGTSLKVCLKDP